MSRPWSSGSVTGSINANVAAPRSIGERRRTAARGRLPDSVLALPQAPVLAAPSVRVPVLNLSNHPSQWSGLSTTCGLDLRSLLFFEFVSAPLRSRICACVSALMSLRIVILPALAWPARPPCSFQPLRGPRVPKLYRPTPAPTLVPHSHGDSKGHSGATFKARLCCGVCPD